MPKLGHALFAMALITFSAIAVSAFAASAVDFGAPEYAFLKSLFSGNFGIFIGLVVTFLGVWQFFVKGDTAFGALLMVLGVVFTLMPTVYTGVRAITCPIAKSLGAACSSQNQTKS